MRAKLLSFIGWLLIRLWGSTLRITLISNAAVEQLQADKKNVIYAFWHGRQFLLVYGFRNTGIVLPASESRDGEIQARILKKFGYGIVRGSSKRKGDRALLGLVDALRKGKDIGLAVDGPRGPIYEVKQGVTYLAGKLGKPIIPASTSSQRHWVLTKIWDKYQLPVPFTRGVIVYGNPITVSGIGEEELESKRRQLTDALNEVMDKSDEYFLDKRS